MDFMLCSYNDNNNNNNKEVQGNYWRWYVYYLDCNKCFTSVCILNCIQFIKLYTLNSLNCIH